MVGITSADYGTSSPVVVLMWIITASIRLYSNLSAPKVDKLMYQVYVAVMLTHALTFQLGKIVLNPCQIVSLHQSRSVSLFLQQCQ